MEALLNRAELLLWKCRKELYFGKLDELKKKCVKERDDVLRMEGNLFAKLRRDYEERLEEKEKEFFCANLELEQAEKELAEIEEKIVLFEGVSSIYKADDLNDEEKELHVWCEMMEKGWAAFSSLHKWMADAEAKRQRVYSNPTKVEKNEQMHDALDSFFLQLDAFLSAVGRVRYLPGIRIKNGFRTNRTTVMGGKTLVFMREGYGPFRLDLHECYLREMKSGWATGEALGRKLKEIECLENLCRGIVMEKVSLGEELVGKVKMSRFQPVEKDIFGFEKKG
jgi:hypothetical protein